MPNIPVEAGFLVMRQGHTREKQRIIIPRLLPVISNAIRVLTYKKIRVLICSKLGERGENIRSNNLLIDRDTRVVQTIQPKVCELKVNSYPRGTMVKLTIVSMELYQV